MAISHHCGRDHRNRSVRASAATEREPAREKPVADHY
jgi:hypothetical protein